ncbi:histidine kinase [Amycolatopsis sp. NPDC004378]
MNDHKDCSDQLPVLDPEQVARAFCDSLGHVFAAVTVRAGAARRVLEVAGDTDLALAQVREAESASRTALGEVRAFLSGQPDAISLLGEAVKIKIALAGAGIDADLPNVVDSISEPAREATAHALRVVAAFAIDNRSIRTMRVQFNESTMVIELGARDESVDTAHWAGRLENLLRDVDTSLTFSVATQGSICVIESHACDKGRGLT